MFTATLIFFRRTILPVYSRYFLLLKKNLSKFLFDKCVRFGIKIKNINIFNDNIIKKKTTYFR